MASNGPNDAPTSSAATPGEGPPAKVPSEKEIARKLRKRELDRRAQRTARERTRNRIAELEAQVKELRKDDSTRLSACMEQLATVSKERDRLADTLKAIEQTIHDNVQPSAPRPVGKRSVASTTSTSLSDCRDLASASSATVLTVLPAHTAPAYAMGAPEAPSAVHFRGVHGFHSHGHVIGGVPNGMSTSSVHAPSSTSESQDLVEDVDVDVDVDVDNDDDDDDCLEGHDDPSVIVPPPEVPCDCLAVRTPAGPAPPRVNVWRAVNQVLAKRSRLSKESHAAEDATDEDIPVRVLLEGWDAVARSRPLSKLWRKLRRVDELCFHACPKTERLAILRTMHLLLQYHSDPTPQRYAKLPTWYLKRPSQAMPHSYAIDFFVWPGVRERFVFGQHHYCNNQFWELFGPNFHVLWPYEFRDAYKKSLVTGRYQISPMFEQRISDINSWTMGVDFFTRFPELIADIPAFHSISQSLTPTVASPPPLPQQASLSQLKERDENRPMLDQHEHEHDAAAATAGEPDSGDIVECSQPMQVYPHGMYSMAAPAFMEDFIPQGYDATMATASYGPLQGYF